MVRTYTTDFEIRALSELGKMNLDEGFEQDFIYGRDFSDEITVKQRFTLWGLFFKYVEQFPDDMKPVIEQVALVSQAQIDLATADVKDFSDNLIYRLRIPFQKR